jgi:hypothetical protein
MSLINQTKNKTGGLQAKPLKVEGFIETGYFGKGVEKLALSEREDGTSP